MLFLPLFSNERPGFPHRLLQLLCVQPLVRPPSGRERPCCPCPHPPMYPCLSRVALEAHSDTLGLFPPHHRLRQESGSAASEPAAPTLCHHLLLTDPAGFPRAGTMRPAASNPE